MHSPSRWFFALAVVAICCLAGLAWQGSRDRLAARTVAGDESKPATTTGRDADRAAIRKSMKSFLTAFEKGDARNLAAHWTAEGEYISDDGLTLRGRAAIQKAYATFFAKHPSCKVEAEVETLRFPSRDTAIEEGHLKVRLDKSSQPTTSRYSVLHVREGERWLMAVVREWHAQPVGLGELEWLIGSWRASRDGVEVNSTYEWDLDRSFLRMRFHIKEGERTVSGMQLIGKDASSNTLRSWTFESGGGFGEAALTRDGNRWSMESTGILPDGSTLSATNILTRINEDTFTWQSVNRSIDGEELPDLPPVKVTRVRTKK